MHARTDLRLHTPTQAHTLAHTHTHIHIGLHKQINTHALTHNIYMEKESSFSFLLLFMSSSFVMMTSVVKRNVTARVISLNQLILSAIIITSSRSKRFGVFMYRSIFKSHLKKSTYCSYSLCLCICAYFFSESMHHSCFPLFLPTPHFSFHSPFLYRVSDFWDTRKSGVKIGQKSREAIYGRPFVIMIKRFSYS